MSIDKRGVPQPLNTRFKADVDPESMLDIKISCNCPGKTATDITGVKLSTVLEDVTNFGVDFSDKLNRIFKNPDWHATNGKPLPGRFGVNNIILTVDNLVRQGVIPFNPYKSSSYVYDWVSDKDFQVYASTVAGLIGKPVDVKTDSVAAEEAAVEVEKVEREQAADEGEFYLEILSVRKTLSVVGDDAVKAEEFIELEKTQDAPRGSLISSLKRVMAAVNPENSDAAETVEADTDSVGDDTDVGDDNSAVDAEDVE